MQTLCICLKCGVGFTTFNCYIKRGGGKYCSTLCYEESKVGSKHIFRDKEAWRKAISSARKGQATVSGSKQWKWKGGVTPFNTRRRSSMEYRNWKVKVFIRDRRTCQNCGYKGRDIEAHHIKPISQFPELGFEIDNGMTLCKDCHRIETIKHLKLRSTNHERRGAL